MNLGFRHILSLLALVSLDCLGEEPAKPNVLFLAVDDMKDWVGCLGGYEGKVHTPNIDPWPSVVFCFPTPIAPHRNVHHHAPLS